MPLLAILNPRPTPRGTAHPLQRLLGPIRWESMTKAQRLQVERQFIGGGMPYNPSGTYWSLMKYPKQVGGFRLWKQVQFLKNGSCCRNPKACRHNGRSWMTPSPTAPWPSEGFKLREAIMDRRDAVRKIYPDFWVDVPSEDAILDRRASRGEYVRAMKKVERAEKLIAKLKAIKNRVRKNSFLPMVAGGVAAGVAGAVTNKLLGNPAPIAFGVAADGTTFRVVRKSSTREWVVRVYVGGKYHEGRTYYTDDKKDALGTLRAMVGPGGKCWSPEVAYGPKVNRRTPAKRVRRNPGVEQSTIAVPFRQGRKYSIAQIQNWVERHGTPAMKQRFAQAMAQYRRFHKGSPPKYITYSLYKMGSHKGISDVEFGVSEGREWMAAYQVPRSSGKWMDKASGGRYVHAHGDSDIEVDIKRPVKLSKLPMRFHTPDGKAVGVIPSKNVKIGEWYEG